MFVQRVEESGNIHSPRHISTHRVQMWKVLPESGVKFQQHFWLSKVIGAVIIQEAISWDFTASSMTIIYLVDVMKIVYQWVNSYAASHRGILHFYLPVHILTGEWALRLKRGCRLFQVAVRRWNMIRAYHLPKHCTAIYETTRQEFMERKVIIFICFHLVSYQQSSLFSFIRDHNLLLTWNNLNQTLV